MLSGCVPAPLSPSLPLTLSLPLPRALRTNPQRPLPSNRHCDAHWLCIGRDWYLYQNKSFFVSGRGGVSGGRRLQCASGGSWTLTGRTRLGSSRTLTTSATPWSLSLCLSFILSLSRPDSCHGLCLSLSVCLSVYLSVFLSLRLSLCLSIYLSPLLVYTQTHSLSHSLSLSHTHSLSGGRDQPQAAGAAHGAEPR